MKKLTLFISLSLAFVAFLIFCSIIAILTYKSTEYVFFVSLSILLSFYITIFLKKSFSVKNKKRLIALILPKYALSRSESVVYFNWKVGARRLTRQKQCKKKTWFLVMGSQRGKSTLLAQSCQGKNPTHKVTVPTRTIKWWYGPGASYLEISSRFLNNSNSVNRCWSSLLRWFRSVPRPAGLIICLSAADLMDCESEEHLQALHIRTLLEPLTEKTGVRLPVHVVITGCDSIPGFEQWVVTLSQEQQRLALGCQWLVSSEQKNSESCFTEAFFSSLRSGLNQMRCDMFNGKPFTADTPVLLAFPEQMMKLQSCLNKYLQALYSPSHFFVKTLTPGGVWFTGLKKSNITSGQQRTIFSEKLFTHILPEEAQNRAVEYIHRFRHFLNRWSYSVLTTALLILLCASSFYTLNLAYGQPDSNIKDKVRLLMRIEDEGQHFWRYLPLQSVLNYKKVQLENEIVANNPQQDINNDVLLNTIRQHFLQADLIQKRTIIINLARAINTEQSIMQGASITTLLRQPFINTFFSMMENHTDDEKKELLVRQRNKLMKTEGKQELLAMRHLLVELVNTDDYSRWLLSPVAEFTSLDASKWFPVAKNTNTLDGIWTIDGVRQIKNWIAEIRLATKGTGVLTPLDTLEKNLSNQRQMAWMKFIIRINQQPLPVYNENEWSNILLSIAHGNGPVMDFLATVNAQLADIEDKNSCSWLRLVRHFVELQANEFTSLITEKVSYTGQNLISKIFPSLRRDSSDAQLNSVLPSFTKVWSIWKRDLSTAISWAVNTPHKSVLLTEGLFQPDGNGKNNPLLALTHDSEALRKALGIQEEDAEDNAIWQLYDRQRELLVAHAMQQTAMWLQQQWQERVLWPMAQNAKHETYAAQKTNAQHYVKDFLNGPARKVLKVDGQKIVTGNFAGQHVGLSERFLFLANENMVPDDFLAIPERDNTRKQDVLSTLSEEQKTLEAEIAQLEEKSVDISLHSLPATIPGGAKVLPVGTILTLYCDDRNSELKSMNLDNQAVFHWRPGHCSRVQEIIRFPGFTLQHNYLGDSAWADFLTDMSSGEHLFDATDFPQQTNILAAEGINKILLRYHVDSDDSVLDTWTQWQNLNEKLNDNALSQQENLSQNDSITKERDLSEIPTTIVNQNLNVLF
ncbi:hypothetical protein CU788_19780 [Salmonella enterica]|nr:hypothetical protein [Salmonella enterica]EGW2853017.1 hypothetical protein [Salmonella enterica]